MARKLIERYRRKPDMDPSRSTPIKLADGQEWYLPRPMIELRPHFKDGEAVRLSRFLTCGEDLDRMIEGISQAEDGVTRLLAVLRLGGDLLLRNYDLTQGELEQLFRYRIDDHTGQSEEMVTAIIDVATGNLPESLRTPKLHADGSS